MSRFPLYLTFVAAACAAAGQETDDVKGLVNGLRAEEVSTETREAILSAGKAARPALRDLAKDGPPLARARAAVLLYRLGQAEALETLAALASAEERKARSEAVAALRAFLGEPMGYSPAAAEGRKAARERWRNWWHANREAALDVPPMSRLYGRVLTADPETGLVVIDLAKRHGAQRGMRLTVRRGPKPVCSVKIVHPGEDKSIARVVDLSVQARPEAGDLAFYVQP